MAIHGYNCLCLLEFQHLCLFRKSYNYPTRYIYLMSDHDEAIEEIRIHRQELNGQAQVSQNTGILRGQSSQAEGERPKTITLNAQADSKPTKRREKTSSKLIISAEVSQGLWDSVQVAIQSNKYSNVSELVRRAVARELGKPIRLK